MRILESAIESGGDIVSSKSSPEDGEEDANITLQGSAVVISPDQEKDKKSRVVTPDPVKSSPDSSAAGQFIVSPSKNMGLAILLQII